MQVGSAIVVYGSYFNYENNDTAIVAVLDNTGNCEAHYYAQFRPYGTGDDLVYAAVFYGITAYVIQVGLLDSSADMTTMSSVRTASGPGGVQKILEIRL